MPAKTMLFGRAPQIPEAQAKPSPVKPVQVQPVAHQPAALAPAEPGFASNRTMLGAPPVNLNETARPAAGVPMIRMASAKPAQAEPAAPTAQRAPVAVDTARTMLGMPAVDSGDVQAAIQAAKQATAVGAPVTTPATGPSPDLEETRVAPPDPSQKARPAQAKSAPPEPEEEDDTPSRGPSTGLIIAVAVAGTVVLGLLAFLGVRYLLSGRNEPVPQIAPTADGQHLTVTLQIPGAAPGSSLSVQGQTIPMTEGSAQFLLPRSALVLGTNLVEFTLVQPDGRQEKRSFPITLRHVVTNDLSLLAADPAAVEVKFQVAEGFRVTVNNQPCPLAGNTCTHRIALEEIRKHQTRSDGDELRYTLNFQLTDPDGRSESGQHLIAIPVTPLQIDRPAPGAVVDTAEVTVAGTAGDKAEVTVNGALVLSNASGFATIIPLDKTGPHRISVTSRLADHAPNRQELEISRVESLQPFIDSWKADADPKFDYPKLTRNTAVHAGRKIVLSGRIININTAAGVTVFLLYVDRGCPVGGRCAVHVTFRGETDAGLESMVNVYGTVSGMKDVDFSGGKSQMLPSVDARFVVSAQPGTNR